MQLPLAAARGFCPVGETRRLSVDERGEERWCEARVVARMAVEAVARWEGGDACSSSRIRALVS